MLKALLLFSFLYAIIARINIAINKTLLHDIKEDYVPIIVSQILNYPIPSIEFQGMRFQNFKILNLTIPTQNVDASLVNGSIQIQVTDSHLQLYLQTVKTILSFDIKVDINVGIAIDNLTISLDYNTKGPGNFTIRRLNVTAGKLELGLTGWMKVIIAWLIEGDFDNGSLQTAIQNNLRRIVKTGLQLILNDKTFPPKVKILGDNLYLNITPIKSPTITDDLISIKINGTFYNEGQEAMIQSYGSASYLPMYDNSSSSKIQILISNNSLNSMLFSIWQNRLLDFNVTKEDVSSDMFGLDSGSLSIAIPGISKYGDNQEVYLHCYSGPEQAAPSMVLKQEKIYLGLRVLCEVYVNNTKNWTRAVNIQTTLNALVEADMIDDKIRIKIIEGKSSKVAYSNSTVGGMSNSVLNEVINMVIGSSLPFEKIIDSWDSTSYNLYNLRMNFKSNFIEMLTDYKYV